LVKVEAGILEEAESPGPDSIPPFREEACAVRLQDLPWWAEDILLTLPHPSVLSLIEIEIG